MNSNNLIERYSIIKKYPSTIELRVTETNYLALVNSLFRSSILLLSFLEPR